MTKEELEKLIHMNQRLNLVLGYAVGFIFNNVSHTSDDPQYKWIIAAVENLLYLDKPLPIMP